MKNFSGSLPPLLKLLLCFFYFISLLISLCRSKAFNRLVFSMACPGKYNPWNVLRVTHDYYFGDWLFLYYVAKNLDNYVFKELLEHLAHDMEDRRATIYGRNFSTIDEAQPLKKKKNGEKDIV